MKSKNMKIKDQEEIVQLIISCLTGKASDGELDMLESWVLTSPQNKKYYHQMKNIWEASGGEINLRDIQTEKAFENVMRQIPQQSRVRKLIKNLQRIAAILLIPVMVASYFWGRSRNFDKILPQKLIYNEITAAFGTRTAITLSDGSKVWLNSGSRLKYPDKFTSRNREVELDGEGYFEVESNKSRPFIVKTKTLDVKAIGTEFCVNAYNRDGKTDITLVKGMVTVIKKLPGKRSDEIAKMQPNQHLLYDTLTSGVSLTNEDPYRFIAWKDGKLIFRNEPLENVVKEISYFYNVDIELEGEKLKEYRYRATFEEENINEILKLLKLSSPVNFVELDRLLLPDGTFQKKKFIIYPVNEKP
jgi:transmembrane sensor